MEHNENNPFIRAMQEERPEKPAVSSPELPVNPTAERVVNTLASLLLWLGIIAAVILFIIGLFFLFEEEDSWWIFWSFAVVAVLVSVVEWAVMKMFVNISRNLYNINAALRKDR